MCALVSLKPGSCPFGDHKPWLLLSAAFFSQETFDIRYRRLQFPQVLDLFEIATLWSHLRITLQILLNPSSALLELEFDIIFWTRASFIHNLLVPERYFLIEWVTFLLPVVKIEQKCLALFVFEKTQWSSSELSIFYKPEGSRGKRQRRTLSSKVGSAKIRGADVKTRPGQGLQPQRLHTRFLDTWLEEFSASSKVAF